MILSANYAKVITRILVYLFFVSMVDLINYGYKQYGHGVESTVK